MKKASELYPNFPEDKYSSSERGYGPMLEEFGEILIERSVGSYQGDMLVLYKKSGEFGFLSFGYGSCSGCDSYLWCESIEALQNLMDSLYEDIVWKDTAEEMKFFLKKRDWKGCYYGYSGEVEEVVKEFICELNKFV